MDAPERNVNPDNLTREEYRVIRDEGYEREGSWLTTREALVEIQKILARSGDPENVATVLRALRGPDDQDEEVKHETTMKIRHAAMGYEAGQLFGQAVDGRVSNKVLTAKQIGGTYPALPHFVWTTRRAADILGILEMEEGEEKGYGGL